MPNSLRRAATAVVCLTAVLATTTSGRTAAAAAPAGGIQVDLSITKTAAPDPVAAGANLTYTITVKNLNLSTAAAGGEMDDMVPSGTTFVSLTTPAGWTSTTPSVGGTGAIQSTIATVAPNSTAVFTLVVKVDPGFPPGAQVGNQAIITAQTVDNVPGNNTSTVFSNISNLSDMTITKIDTPDPVPAGGTLLYTITLTNNGPSNAGVTTMSDTLPASTTFSSLVAPGGWALTTPPVGSTGTVTATILALPAGSVAQFQLSVVVPAATPIGTVISNTATASWLPTSSCLSAAVSQSACADAAIRTGGGSSPRGPTATTTPTSAIATTTVAAAVPALPRVVFFLLVGALLGTSAWLLRRRHAGSAA